MPCFRITDIARNMGNYVSFILTQMAGKFEGKPANMRIIAAGSELQPGSEALYVTPDVKSPYQIINMIAPEPNLIRR
jgi:hypothetical protein